MLLKTLLLFGYLPTILMVVISVPIGLIAYLVMSTRRRIAIVNLQQYFPNKKSWWYQFTVVRHFVCLVRCMLDQLTATVASDKRVKRLNRIYGLSNLDKIDEPIIFLTPHFLGLIQGVGRISLDYPISVVMQKQHTKIVREIQESYADRYKIETLASHNVRQIVRMLQPHCSLNYDRI